MSGVEAERLAWVNDMRFPHLRPNLGAARFAVAVLLLCAAPLRTSANFVPPLTLAQMTSASDVVAVVHLKHRGIVDAGARGVLQVATVGIDEMLQGNVGREITVVTIGNDPEGDLGALARGHKYLLFLQRDQLGLFEATDGRGPALDLGRFR